MNNNKSTNIFIINMSFEQRKFNYFKIYFWFILLVYKKYQIYDKDNNLFVLYKQIIILIINIVCEEWKWDSERYEKHST